MTSNLAGKIKHLKKKTIKLLLQALGVASFERLRGESAIWREVVREGFLEEGAGGGAKWLLLCSGVLLRGLCSFCSPSPPFL